MEVLEEPELGVLWIGNVVWGGLWTALHTCVTVIRLWIRFSSRVKLHHLSFTRNTVSPELQVLLIH